ncbi:hypothetical protein [Argonema galeatum]|uniref:hypothetical protein n=1 Tax=Argonema galeatum TaxID=2942762 RepID=UPI002011209F|nr:hypothetical protein [Argonema galeatum]MCL1464396.1 hypothetical protein [Argonema galeatum A003/A1]
MTVFLFASSATAYVFSGIICYLASMNGWNLYSQLTDELLRKALVRLWITGLWPLWIIREIGGDYGYGTSKTLAINPIVCSDSEASLKDGRNQP